MKKSFMKPIMGGVLVGLALSASAETPPPSLPGNPTPTPKKEVLLPPKKELPTRPNSPARVYLRCEYAKGYILLTIPEGSYYVTIHLYNEVFDWTGLATVDQPRVDIPEDLSGEYTIICRTDDGRVFSGTLEF